MKIIYLLLLVLFCSSPVSAQEKALNHIKEVTMVIEPADDPKPIALMFLAPLHEESGSLVYDLVITKVGWYVNSKNGKTIFKLAQGEGKEDKSTKFQDLPLYGQEMVSYLKKINPKLSYYIISEPTYTQIVITGGLSVESWQPIISTFQTHINTIDPNVSILKQGLNPASLLTTVK
jgi:hypothetical protein